MLSVCPTLAFSCVAPRERSDRGPRQLQCPSCAARDFLSGSAPPREHEFRKRAHLGCTAGRSPAPRPASHDLHTSPPSSAAPLRREDSLQHRHRAQLRSPPRRSCSPRQGAAPPTPDARLGTTSAVSRHNAGSSVGSTLASTTTTAEPRRWLGRRSKRPPQSPRRQCAPRPRATTLLARPRTTVPLRRGTPRAAAR